MPPAVVGMRGTVPKMDQTQPQSTVSRSPKRVKSKSRPEKRSPEKNRIRRPGADMPSVVSTASEAASSASEASETSAGPLAGRSFLLLQGPQSYFFRRLADRLRAKGATVAKVNFCGGDAVLWGLTNPAIAYTGDIYGWPEWVGNLYRERGITDICLYGDWRPLHWEAVRLAHVRGIRVWVFEEGYLRSGFSTLEENGVNGRSSLPTNPKEIHALARDLPDPSEAKLENDLHDKVTKAILHHAGNFFLWPKYRHYRTHRPTNIFFELLGILPRYLKRASRAATSQETLKAFKERSEPYFFFPLQLVTDSQIQLYSPYVRVQEAIADVLSSFARCAFPKTRLLIRNHPLDNGLIRYGDFIRGFARELGIEDRVTYVEDGNTMKMIQDSRGVVLVNSTVGLMALEAGKPVYCLGRSIYNLRGLTQCLPYVTLDRFWRAPQAPDPELYRDFKRVLGERALVRGNFYTDNAMKLAVEDAVERFARSERTKPKSGMMVLRLAEEPAPVEPAAGAAVAAGGATGPTGGAAASSALSQGPSKRARGRRG